MTFLFLVQRLFALISLAVLGASGAMIWRWWDQEQALREYGLADRHGDGLLYAGLALLALSLLGRFLWPLVLGKGGKTAQDKPDRTYDIAGPNGECLHVEVNGPPTAPALVFTHGWGLSSAMWREARRELSGRYRVVSWDLPGLGQSKGPKDGRYTMERFAEALRTVVDSVDGGPSVLAGHSIGGMIVQTFCRQYPDALGSSVAGIVLENTTHTNPLRTTVLGGLLRAIQRPVIEPAMRLDILLNPLVWAMNWQSYLSGSMHLAMRLGGFGTQPTREQLNRVALLSARNSPAVQAKGALAMMRWDATPDLRNLRVPALVFIGGRDLITVPKAGETIAATIPGATRFRVQQAGHMGPVECHETYNAAVAEFADKVLTSDARWADRGPAAAFQEQHRTEPGEPRSFEDQRELR
ncbi:MAG: alpha/beta fold hydrolase [Caulobacteraceae bacterium]